MDSSLVYQAVLEIYRYYNWYELYELHKAGSIHASDDQLWASIYRKYFPKNVNYNKNFFTQFFIDLVKRLDYFLTLFEKDVNNQNTALYHLIHRFVQYDEQSLIRFLLDKFNDKYLWVIKFTTLSLRNNVEIMSHVVTMNFEYMPYTGVRVRNNIDFVRKIIRKHGNYCLDSYLSYNFKRTVNILREFIQENWAELDYADQDIGNDITFMKTIIKRDWRAVKYAAPVITCHPEIMLSAIKQNTKAFQYISGDLKYNRDFLFGILNNNPNFLFEIVNDNPNCIPDVPEILRNDVAFMKIIIDYDWHNLKYAGLWVRINADFMLSIIKQHPEAFQYASLALINENDAEFVFKAMEYNTEIFPYIPPHLKNDELFLRKIIRKYPKLIQYAPKNLTNDVVFMKSIVQQD